MNLSLASYTGDGVQTDFAVTFPFLNRSHVKAYVGGTPTAFEWLHDGLVRFATAPEDGIPVVIQRETPRDEPMVTFQNRTVRDARAWNQTVLQMLYSAQEMSDAYTGGASVAENAAAAALSAAEAAASAQAAADTAESIYQSARYVSVADYAGADPSGATSSDAAFAAAIAGSAGRNNAVIYIPAGRWKVSKILLENRDVRILGDGSSVTTLVITDPDGPGLHIKLGLHQLTLEGIRIEPDTVGTAKAIYIEQLGIPSALQPNVRLRDVVVTRNALDVTKYFREGIHLYNCALVYVDHVHVSGRWIGVDEANATLYGIKADGDYTTFNFSHCFLTDCIVGLDIGGKIEGVTANALCIFATRVGLRKYHATTGEPLLFIMHSLFDCEEIGVEVFNCTQVDINGCFFFSGARKDKPGWTGVKIDGQYARGINIDRSYFLKVPSYSGTTRAVHMLDGYFLIGTSNSFESVDEAWRFEDGLPYTSYVGKNNYIAVGTQFTDLSGLVARDEGTGVGTHQHVIGDVINLQTTIDDLWSAIGGKAATVHTHAWADITSRPTTLSGYGITDAEPLGRVTAVSDVSGTSETLTSSHMGRLVRTTGGDPVTLTVANDASGGFSGKNARIDVMQYGAGKVTFAAGEGVTIRSVSDYRSIRVQYAFASLVRIGANEWALIGDLTA